MNNLIEVKHLSISYDGRENAVSDVSLSMAPGEILSVVGESGSGKSTLIRGILGLLSGNGEITEGEILFEGENLISLPEKQMQKVRGEKIAMIFQDAGLAMDPVKTVESQFIEYILTHKDVSREESWEIAKDWLGRMNLHDPERVLKSYPFELSGGMKQRAAIAMAMSMGPKLLLADEPTSALDVTVQAQVVFELQKLAEKYGTAIILVTHNMGVASYISDSIAVMKLGQLVEYGTRDQVINNPSSEYTRMLLDAVPKLISEDSEVECQDADIENGPETGAALLDVSGLKKVFEGNKKKAVTAVDNVNFKLFSGECLGVVGESGCGKSTIARMVIGSTLPSDGHVILGGMEYGKLKGKNQRDYRRNVQMIFQNPISSFSPRMTIGDYLYEPLRNYEKLSRTEAEKRISSYMDAVGLPMDFLKRHPHELSGGQLQRVVIARAVLMQPELIVCDEATSALDVSIQNQVAEMLMDLQKQWNLSYLFIGHDLALVQRVSQRILVMYLGNIVEVLDSRSLVNDAVHPYTRVLLDAVFDVYEDRNRRREILEKNTEESRADVRGCKFAPRCPMCTERCMKEAPELRLIKGNHMAACHAV